MLLNLLRSIRFRITFWFTLTVVVIQAATALFSFHHFSRALREQADANLQEIARQVGEAFVADGWESLGTDDGCSRLRELIHRENWNTFIQVRGSSLQLLCTSENLLGNPLPFSPVTRQQVRKLNPHRETLEEASDGERRLLTIPLHEGRRLLGAVQVAEGLGSTLQTMENLRLIYLLVGPFAIVCLWGGCWLLAGRYVASLVTVSDAARTIDADSLWRRLPAMRHRDELASMVDNFNQMLDRLEEGFRRVRQFSGDASHELRTPLTIMRGETEVALRWVKEPEEFRDILRSNLEEIERMERIIEQLLLLAKSEVRELTMDVREMNLTEFIEGLCAQARILAEAKQLKVTLTLSGEQPIHLHGDPLRLRQMMLNLIANAVKYTPAEGTLELTIGRHNGLARIEVRDSGIGIPAEDLPFLFDRFYRVDKARNRMDGGSGLGLSIVRAIANEHGGQVSVASTPGQGSTFTVLLPLAPPEATASAVPAAS